MGAMAAAYIYDVLSMLFSQGSAPDSLLRKLDTFLYINPSEW